jgi:putative transposase
MKYRQQLVDIGHKKLSIRKQCNLLQVSRSSYYYEPCEEKPENIEMMETMDKHLIHHPTEGVESMVFYMKYVVY